jgi:hypothetical protein
MTLITYLFKRLFRECHVTLLMTSLVYHDGRDLDHWLEAEKSVQSKEAVVASTKSSISKKATYSGPAKKKVAA